MASVKVGYVEANDAAGKYRWWTPQMLECGQFCHANTLQEVEELAAKELAPLIDLYDQAEIDEEKDAKPDLQDYGHSGNYHRHPLLSRLGIDAHIAKNTGRENR